MSNKTKAPRKSRKKSEQQIEAPVAETPVVAEAAQVEAEVEAVEAAPVYAAKIKSVEDLKAIEEEDPAAAKELKLAAATSARRTYGTTSEPQRNPETGEARRDTIGRLIPHYTPRRPADVVAADELLRMQRLAWAQSARAACVNLKEKVGRDLKESEVESIYNAHAPKSYRRKFASKPLFQRAFGYVASFGS